MLQLRPIRPAANISNYYFILLYIIYVYTICVILSMGIIALLILIQISGFETQLFVGQVVAKANTIVVLLVFIG